MRILKNLLLSPHLGPYIRLMCLRDKVQLLSTEEGCPYDINLLSKRFLKSFVVGIRNGNLRNDLRESCKTSINDEDLLKLVAEAVSNEAERTEKLNLKKSSVDVSEISEKSVSSKEKHKDNPFDKIEEMKISHQKEMSSVRAELLEIKNVLKSGLPSSNIDRNNSTGFPNQFDRSAISSQRGQTRSRRNNRCRDCESKNKTGRCMHCFLCGSFDHMTRVCPNRVPNQN